MWKYMDTEVSHWNTTTLQKGSCAPPTLPLPWDLLLGLLYRLPSFRFYYFKTFCSQRALWMLLVWQSSLVKKVRRNHLLFVNKHRGYLYARTPLRITGGIRAFWVLQTKWHKSRVSDWHRVRHWASVTELIHTVSAQGGRQKDPNSSRLWDRFSS